MHNRSELAWFSKSTNDQKSSRVLGSSGLLGRNRFILAECGPKFGASLLYVCTTTGETVTSKPFAEVTRSEYAKANCVEFIRPGRPGVVKIFHIDRTRCFQRAKQCQSILPLSTVELFFNPVLLTLLFDAGHDGFLDLSELKRMMEVLGAPQTHLGLKAMIQEVDEDGDGRISFREFLLIYRKARAGELEQDSGLGQLARLTEVDVDEVGVTGAKHFFEAKIEQLRKSSKFENEIRMEQEERKREEEEKATRRAQFRQKAALFGN
ncbi:hypothetical protein K0M31_019640 [Melipona bicolor]|uniref:EF-hand domain-containing protein n=1 Tax=Melipona bicolor TaxID=60889 RepID=A0AA40KRC3_9HYME|nr:hypothetical protein K0M31_019640 [Melipona bicolor]